MNVYSPVYDPPVQGLLYDLTKFSPFLGIPGQDIRE
jgi:hypothetical protein